MENTLVSARVPSYKKEQAKVILDEIGATTSELINSAFDYVIENRKLPNAKELVRRRSRTSEAEFQEFLEKVTIKDFDWSWHDAEGDPYYKKAIQDGKVAEYEALV